MATENQVADMKVEELKARSRMWDALAKLLDKLGDALVDALAESKGRGSDPEITRQGGRTTVVDPSARRR